jgi:methylmalonyl-CoA/ethylmalonyl-CoA epimerase
MLLHRRRGGYCKGVGVSVTPESIEHGEAMGSESSLRFDHVGVVVGEIEVGRAFFAEALGIDRWTEVFADPGLGVSVQFGVGASGPCYELIAPLGENSPVAAALRGGQRILNHVAYLTADLEAEGAKFAGQGCCAAGPAHPAVAYGGRRVQFWVSPLRFMVELIEAPEHEHVYLATGAQS